MLTDFSGPRGCNCPENQFLLGYIWPFATSWSFPFTNQILKDYLLTEASLDWFSPQITKQPLYGVGKGEFSVQSLTQRAFTRVVWVRSITKQTVHISTSALSVPPPILKFSIFLHKPKVTKYRGACNNNSGHCNSTLKEKDCLWFYAL